MPYLVVPGCCWQVRAIGLSVFDRERYDNERDGQMKMMK
jgi:hypothetical protein